MRLAGPAEDAVRQTLTAKGLTETTREQADCAVLVKGEAVPKVEVANMGYTPGIYGRSGVYYPHGPPVTELRTTKQRRLLVEVYDNQTRRLAWVGWMERTGTSKVEPEKVQEGVRRILEGFPPATKSH